MPSVFENLAGEEGLLSSRQTPPIFGPNDLRGLDFFPGRVSPMKSLVSTH